VTYLKVTTIPEFVREARSQLPYVICLLDQLTMQLRSNASVQRSAMGANVFLFSVMKLIQQNLQFMGLHIAVFFILGKIVVVIFVHRR
jgi:small neutral amino acid transporter SnatA (MarC family)